MLGSFGTHGSIAIFEFLDEEAPSHGRILSMTRKM
jgi:hypothetical protein